MRNRDASFRRTSADRGPLRPYVLLGQREQLMVRRRRWRRLLLALALLAPLVGLAALYFSPLFRVHTVEVRGTYVLRPEEVAALADLGGRSIFRLPLAQVEQRLSGLDMVKAVQVRPRLPDTVVITVQERQPWARWQRGNNVYVVDEEGVVLGRVSSPDGIPTIIDATGGESLRPGERVSPSTVLLAVRLTQELPRSLGTRPVRFEFSRQDGLAVTTDANYRVVLGDADALDYKLAVWAAVQQRLGLQGLQGRVLDLRFGDRPALR